MDSFYWIVSRLYPVLEATPLIVLASVFAVFAVITAILVKKSIKGRDDG